jgi:hypothetical protein
MMQDQDTGPNNVHAVRSVPVIPTSKNVLLGKRPGQADIRATWMFEHGQMKGVYLVMRRLVAYGRD